MTAHGQKIRSSSLRLLLKTTLFLSALFFLNCFASLPKLFENRLPHPALKALLEESGISSDLSQEEICDATQQEWYQGVERWELRQKLPPHCKEVFLPFFEKLNCLETIYPAHKRYLYAFIHGAKLVPVQKRLLFLIQLWDSGVRFKRLFFLTGDRDLMPDEQEFFPSLKNEAEMMEAVWNSLNVSEDLRQIPLEIISCPKIYKEGILKRPDTESTLKLWLEKNCPPGSCLLLSNQPHVACQHAIADLYLPSSGYTIETVGPGAAKTPSLENLFDNLGRWIYWESKKL